MERIYTDTYDFERMRQEGGVYVDKTDVICRLVDKSIGFQFFLARPRRFGKSLLVSTIQRIFEGRRDLFEGLAIAETDWDWEGEKCPVLRLDMSLCVGTMEEVRDSVLSVLDSAASAVGVGLDRSRDLSEMFNSLIQDAAAASPTGKVVLLIDEYDKPLLQHIGTPEVTPFQDFLKRFYAVVKATEHLQRFCLLTGVSEFSKVSIFSNLNNLVDLTMDLRVSSLLGYTHEEVARNFPEALQALADARGTDVQGAFDALVDSYDGYCFDKSMTRVFNPVSLGRALSASDIRSYWFETGTPGWLMSYARKAPMRVEDMELDDTALGTFEPAEPEMTAVLFQTGYLTIKSVDDSGRWPSYRLGFPNYEVADGFNTWLARAYVGDAAEQTSVWRTACRRAVRSGDVAAFVESLQSFFASIGYDLTDRLSEQAYQAVTVAILRFIGINLAAEVTSSKGRVDMVCRSADHVFVIEMKVATGEAAGEAAAAAAIEQIREKGYAEPYVADAATGIRAVHLLGLSFDCSVHNVVAWECEEL